MTGAALTGAGASVLQVRGLGFSYGRRRILDGLDLPALHPGELAVLLGPNAAGKSTALKAIAGLHPASGEILLGGQALPLMSAAERAGRVGYMPQSLPPATGMSVLEAVIAALGPRWMAQGADPADRAMAVLDRLGIAPLAMAPLGRLSGGQRQLASLAQTIVRGAGLLLLDEPTSALDPARSFAMMATLRALADEGRVLLVVLHDLALAAQWADRLLVLDRGRLHSAGSPDAVLTPAMLAEVYGVEARVERCSRGRPVIQIDGTIPA